MRVRFPIGAQVVLRNPLPGESRGPWRVAGVKLNAAPHQYQLARTHKGMSPALLSADEGELEIFDAARHAVAHRV